MADINFTVGADTTEAESSLKKFASGPVMALGAAAAAAAAAVGAIVLKKSIDAASEYESVVQSLNVALAASGEFSKTASEEMRKWASGLQDATKYSDDQVISTAALIQNLARLSTDGLKQATEASLNLASALQIDLNTASMLIGKAANGNVAAFSRYGIEIRKGTTDTQTFANTLETLSKRFPNAAAAAAQTFSGATAQLKNAFDDMFKELGRSIVGSPSVIAIINGFKKIFSTVAEVIKNAIGGRDIFKPFLSNMVTFGAVVVSTYGPIVEAIGRLSKIVFDSFLTGLRAITTGFLGVGALIEKITNTLGLTDSTYFADATSESFDKLTVSANETADAAVNSLGAQGTMTTAVLDGMASVQGAIDTSSGKLNEFGQNLVNSEKKVPEVVSAWEKALEGLKKTIDSTLVKGFSSGIQSATMAILKGQNAFKAFGSQIFSMMGDIAIQIGETMILTGTAIEALRTSIVGLVGGPSIAAGIALIAFGALLKSLSGGSGAGATGSGGGSGSAATASTEELTNLEEKKPNTSLTVNIQGNVLDRRQTGLEIAEVIQETFGSNGLNFNTA